MSRAARRRVGVQAALIAGLVLGLGGVAAAQEVAVVVRGGGELVGELENVDETRLRIRTPDGAREVPVGALLAVELRSPPLSETEEARKLARELQPLLEVGVAGELARVAALEAWLDARVRELVGPDRLGAWDGWPRWPLESQRGEVAGAPHLDGVAPAVAHAARELAARGEPARGALRLLRAIDTPAARGLLIGLYLDPRFWDPELAIEVVPLLIDMDDPRLARVTRARVRRSWDGPLPELPREQLPLLLRHGGPEVLEAAFRQIAGGGPSSTQAVVAWSALRFARDRRALDMALNAFGWTHLPIPDDDPQVVETLAGLLESFGVPAGGRLFDAVRDQRLPVARRAMAAVALTRASPPDRLPAVALLGIAADGAPPRLVAEIVRGLAVRADVALSEVALDQLQARALLLLESPAPATSPDADLRAAAAEAIGARAALHTEAARTALRRALRQHPREPSDRQHSNREPALAEAALARALEAVERTLAGGPGADAPAPDRSGR